MKHMPQVIAVMTPFPHTADTVEADVPLDRVAAAMAERHVGSALVTKAGKLVGVFTGTDACRALAQVPRSLTSLVRFPGGHSHESPLPPTSGFLRPP
jgi:CBS domain-containing protein